MRQTLGSHVEAMIYLAVLSCLQILDNVGQLIDTAEYSQVGVVGT